MSTPTRDVRPERLLAPRRGFRSLRRHGVSPETRLSLGLGALSTVVALLVVAFYGIMPFTSLMVPLLVGSIFLGPRTLPWFVIYLMVLLTAQVALVGNSGPRIVGPTTVQFTMGLIVLFTSFRRSQLGVGGLRGESMLVDLRDRILTQGGIPALPAGWQVDSAIHSAGGTPFAGDFVVATRVDDPGRPELPGRLELVVVDVSGKGADAGTRALLLSGAFGGLLGATRPDGFLPAANDYMVRQDWDEGFATAVHLSLDLATGRYEVRSAGHPPALHRSAGSGRWGLLDSEGPVLGLIEGADFVAACGVVGPGDSLLLYTDGMVEEPRRDIDLGIDRLLGASEQMLRASVDGAATRLVTALGSPDDDRAMIVVHRS
ncbi:PP2C family protein-serine/threonine phosphatase [Nocardioides sp. AX2bis]|uniref:PP2C family protein-serine/threonine phosphatase n=1 Tax=Nocardioides sp. AX2bis TaxID=2653157 RepID=UPI0012EFD8AB|nr:PP2C family protein-serine/threonine phosphatase [Nocardioides sp. AX2bis]VXB86251.1 Stage II sporulation protein E (SpoIIE) [Nocardioides sp. AX2bis]